MMEWKKGVSERMQENGNHTATQLGGGYVKTVSNSIYFHSSRDQKAMLFLKAQSWEYEKVEQREGLLQTPVPD